MFSGRGQRVLILVLMEDTLRVQEFEYVEFEGDVS